jgi:hypothetical protein
MGNDVWTPRCNTRCQTPGVAGSFSNPGDERTPPFAPSAWGYGDEAPLPIRMLRFVEPAQDARVVLIKEDS